MGLKLFNFQEKEVEFLKRNKTALLATEQGLGKTVTAICAAKELRLRNILVICPASIKYNWQREFKTWYPERWVSIINSSNDRMTGADVHIVNYDLIHRKRVAMQLLARNYEAIIVDEAHYLKNARAKRSKAFYCKGGLSFKTGRVWLMTGTPVMNRPVELFPMLQRFIPDRLGLYADYIAYTKRYCSGYQGKWGWDASGASHVNELGNILHGFMIRHTKKQVMPELPDKIFQKIELDPPSRDIARKVKAEAALFDKNQLLGAFATSRKEIGVAKIPFVVEHLTNLLDEKDKIIVFAHHRDVLDGIRAALTDHAPVLVYGGIGSRQKQELVDTFVSDPKCRLFLGQIDAAGIGIDGLQKVADTVVFAETSWVPGAIKQAIDRCHRIGQVNKVLVQFITMKGGIDEQIFDSVANKVDVIKKLVEKEEGMKMGEQYSIEKNLQRIADALEKLANPVLTLNVPTAAPEVTAVPVEDTMFGDDTPKVEKPKKGEFKTAKDFLAYCNRIILGMDDKVAAKDIVSKMSDTIAKKFGVKSLMAIPEKNLSEAKQIFDQLIAE